jgi:dTDP-4-dehydrorhamnose 3,5-epimerase-like enzyme
MRTSNIQHSTSNAEQVGVIPPSPLEVECSALNVRCSNGVVEYFVSGDKLEVVDIPPGYTHNIENLGDTDMVTVMWCNEIFDPTRPDTIFEDVCRLK